MSDEVISCSVVISSYNSIQTLESTIRSVAKQSAPVQEIIVIDDASTDGTAELVKELSAELESVRHIFREINVGQSENRNLGVSISTGNLIVFCDADDECYPFRIEEHMRMHSMGAEVSYVSTEKIYSTSYRKKFKNSNFGPIQMKPATLASRVLLGKRAGLPANLAIPACSMAINRDTFLNSGGFNTFYRRLEDVEYAIRLAERDVFFCWSSRIALKRFVSVRPDKSGSIDISFERRLNDDFGAYFSNEDIRIMALHTRARKMYFDGDLLGLLLFVFRNPRILANKLFVIRIFNAVKRLKHDLIIFFLSRIWGTKNSR